MIRRLAIRLLLLPLALNGLWLLCREAPLEASVEAQAAQPAQATGDSLQIECERICAVHSRAGSLCLLSPGNKTSLSIIILGLSILQAPIRTGPALGTGQSWAEVPKLHSDPSLAQKSPPPKV